jgi:LysM repeat protein/uncharacterized protein YkwD
MITNQMFLKDSVRGGILQSNAFSYKLKNICLLVSLLILLGMLTAPPTLAKESLAESRQHAGTELSEEARQAALMINRLRIEAGLPPLTVHPLLNLAANLHIQDMIATNHWGHSGSDGSNVRQRITRLGYTIDGWAGENWATYKDIQTSVSWWMTDPPHRDNVLNRAYKEMGIGTAPHPRGWGIILVVDFTTGSSNQVAGAAIVPENAQAPLPQVVVSAPQPVQNVEGSIYTIQSGDTLSTIGQRYGVNWRSIARANGLGEFSVLRIGNQIVLPGVQSVQNQGSAALTQAPAQSAAAESYADAESYTVVAGDTLFGIAMRRQMHWDDLAVYNEISPNAILQIGDKIKIPSSSSAENRAGIGGEAENPPLVQQPTRLHKVQAGETLWSIAATYNVDWYKLMAVNGLKENSLIAIGQEIRLP